MFDFNKEFPGAVLQTLLGAFLTIILYLCRKFITYFEKRNIRKFWRPFIGNLLSLIITEYSPEGSNRFAKLTRVMGDRWLISRGMAFALSNTLDFCVENVTKRKNIIVQGDKSGSQTTDNIIILGSPASNIFSDSMFKHLDEIYDLPFRFSYDKDAVIKEIVIHSPEGEEKLIPSYQNGIGHDYGILIKAVYQKVPLKYVIILLGCHMWGTEALSSAVTNLKILNEVAKHTNSSENITFLIKTRILNNNAVGPELDINNRKYIQVLKPRNIKVPTL